MVCQAHQAQNWFAARESSKLKPGLMLISNDDIVTEKMNDD